MLAALLCGVLPLKTRLMRAVILLACCGGWLLLRQDVQVAGMAGCVLGGALGRDLIPVIQATGFAEIGVGLGLLIGVLLA